MKLYEIPKNSKIKTEIFDDKGNKIGDYVIFHKIDGAYSYCTVEDNKEKAIHLSANTELEDKGDYYDIKLGRVKNRQSGQKP